MTVKEIEERSGMTRANIRFYESEGLVKPERRENGYRAYSDADLDTLLRIRLLRALGVSLDDIRALQAGDAELPDTLRRQSDALLAEQRAAERSRAVCREMLDDGARYATLDAPRYLDALSREMPAAVPQEDELPRVRAPWRRFFARWLDFALCDMCRTLIMLALNVNPSQTPAVLQLLVTCLIQLLVEPLFLCTLGTTPGKWLLGLSVAGADGDRLAYSDAMERVWSVWWYGCGMHVPFLHAYRLFKSCTACTNGETLPWEEESVLTLRDEKPWRAFAYAGAHAAMLCVVLLALLLTLLPKHRGDVTVAQFSENYNRLADFLAPDLPHRLSETGQWKERDMIERGAVRFASDRTMPILYYDEEGGYMTGARFGKTLEGDPNAQGYLSAPSYGTEMQLLLCAFAASQRGAVWRLGELRRALQTVEGSAFRSFDVTACGVRAVCRVEYEGYRDFAAGEGLLFPIQADNIPHFYQMSFSMSK